MIHYKVSRNARILFVGINPHHGSARRGVPFSNNKMFWYLLSRAGLLEEAESELRSDKSLKRIYDRKFMSQYRLNIINLIDKPTRNVAELKGGEEKMGVRRAHRVIREYKPKVVCFIGKVTYNTFRGSRSCNYGWQDKIFDSRAYVAHFPLRGFASVRVKELRELKRAADGLKD